MTILRKEILKCYSQQAAAKHQWREQFEQLNRPEKRRGRQEADKVSISPFAPPTLLLPFTFSTYQPRCRWCACELQIKLRQKRRREQEEGAQSGGSKRQMANGLFRSAFWLAAPWFLPSFLSCVCKSRKAKALLLDARARLSCHFTALHTLQLRAH